MFYTIETVYIQPKPAPIFYNVISPTATIIYVPPRTTLSQVSTSYVRSPLPKVEEKPLEQPATPQRSISPKQTPVTPILTADEQLNANLSRLGYRREPVDGDGNCFFTSTASQLIEFFHRNRSFRQAIRKRLNLSENLFQNSTRLARLLRKLICLEWKLNEKKYKPYINDVNYNDEIRKFRSDKFYSSILGDILPLTMCNLIGIPMKIITNLSECPLIEICPQDEPLLASKSSPVLLLAYNQENEGHYDIAVENVV